MLETKGDRNSTVKTSLTALTPTATLAQMLYSDLPAPQAQISTLSDPSVPTFYTCNDNDTAANLLYKPQAVHTLSFISQRQSGSQNTPLIQLQTSNKRWFCKIENAGFCLTPKFPPSCCVLGHDRWC